MEDINFLYDGMHSDNEPAMQPPNTFREGWNGIITAQGNNRFSYETAKGTVLSFTIPDHVTSQKPFQVIGWTSFVDYLIVLIANDQGSGNDPYPGEIGKVNFSNSGIGTYTPLYFHRNLNFTKEHPVPHDGIVAKPENANIQRVYWTDNYNPLKSLNVADARLTTSIPSGSLVVGNRYMVLSTAANSFITHNATPYGPQQTAGNVFEALNANYAVTGSVIVIEYIPVESLDVVPTVILGNISPVNWLGGGSLKSGAYQYAYQLETTDGFRTNWSYLTTAIHLITPEIPTDQSISYARQIGTVSGTATGKAIKINIAAIDTSFSKIRVAFVRATAEGVYSDPEVFYYESITGASMDITHFGNEPTTKISLGELTKSTAVLDLVKSITATKNILFCGNVGLARDPDFDLSSSVQVRCMEYLMPADVNGLVTNANTIAGGFSVFGHGQVQDAATGNGIIYPDQWYEVAGTGSITYNAVVYNAGNYFKGVGGITTFTVSSGSPKIVAVIRIQRYTGTYRNIRIEKDFCDHKGFLASHYLMSYWRQERYRIGLLIEGTKGNPSFIKYLADKNFPQQHNVSADIDPDNGQAYGFNARLMEYYSSNQQCSLRVLGLRISNIDFNQIAAAYGTTYQNLGQFIKGFSIVRVPRDAQIVAQGVLFGTMVNGTQTEVQAAHKLGYDFYYNGAAANKGRRPNYYAWYSPDFLSSYQGRPNIQLGDKLKIADKYSDVTGADPGVQSVSNHHYYNKYYSQAGGITGGIYANGAETSIVIDRTFSIEHAAEGISISGLPGVFNNRGKTAAGMPTAGERECHGCDMVLVGTDTDETLFPLGYGRFDQFDNHKCIVNWIRPKASNLYGGNSASAKAANKYIFCGHFQPFDAGFSAHLAATGGFANNVEVFGGDAFVSIFGFARVYKNESDVDPQISTACIIPIESNINENWRGWNGPTTLDARTFNRDRTYETTVPTEAPNGIYHATGSSIGYEEQWKNHDVYTGVEKQYFYVPKPLGFKASVRDEHLILYSAEKVDGETLDNWKVFKTDAYKRVNGEFGPINNIRAKSSRLFYWQNKGVGYLPVYERQLQGTALGDAVQLGVGGILERFDEIDYYYGNQHQFGLMESDESFVWFDWRRKSMLSLSYNGQKELISYVKGKDAFFQNKFTEVESEAGNTIFNSENPLTGKGIMSYFDPRHKIGFMTFKYSQTVGLRTIEKDFTIAFNNKLDKFVGFFNLMHNHVISHNGHLLLTREVRPAIVGSTAYVIGDEVNENGGNYICILGYTSAGLPVAPSADSTHWALASSISQVHVAWRGDYAKFFGKVYPWILTMILKGNGLDNIVVDNIEAGGNDTAFTDVFISNSDGSASDLNITTTNRNYRYFDGSWFFNLPLKNKITRLVDHFVELKMQVKNYSGNAVITSLNKVKRVYFVRHFYRGKK